MKKILFIMPPNMTYDRFVNPGFNERVSVKISGNYGSPITDMPLGVISLSAYLKKDAEVKLIDFNILLNKLEDFKHNSFNPLYRDYFSTNILGKYDPDIIGISALFTTGYTNMMDIANVVRDMFPDSTIIAGGGVPTNLYKKIFKESTSFDALCFGEGEKPLLELVKANDEKELLRTHQSWITKEKSESQDSFKHEFIHDLDEIPFFDYGILDFDAYGLSPTLSNLVNYSSFKSNSHVFHYMTSRGCPHRCCFCASHTVHGRKMRYHSLDRVREDFIRLKDQFKADIINFQDDHLMAKKERVHEIINIANEVGLQLYFQNGMTMRSLDTKMLEAMKSAGVTALVLPIESGSSRVLRDIMHKPIDLSIIKQVVDDCRRLGIETDANILIGLPGETKQDIEDTRVFLKSLDVNWYRIVVAAPLVGSEMFKTCIDKNYLSSDDIVCDFKKAIVSTEDFTAEYIEQKAYSLNLEINFVGNSDFRLGNYKKALERFQNTITIKSDHALAYYFSAKCYKMLGLNDEYQVYKKKYQEIIGKSAFWQGYATQFNLLPLS